MASDADSLDWPALREEAISLIRAAEEGDVLLRLVGSVGIRLHLPAIEEMLDGLRPPPKDLDFVCRRADRSALRTLLQEHGYENDRNMMVAMEGRRYLFSHGETGLKLDIFVDRLDFCHRIELSGRLGVHPLTIPSEELLLHKLQIVDLTAGDYIDLGVLLANLVPDGKAAESSFSTARLLAPLANDWGFWRTVTGNLDSVRKHAEAGGYAMLGAEAACLVAGRAAGLRDAAEILTKGLRWRVRAKLGERMPWWQDVDDREGTY